MPVAIQPMKSIHLDCALGVPFTPPCSQLVHALSSDATGAGDAVGGVLNNYVVHPVAKAVTAAYGDETRGWSIAISYAESHPATDLTALAIASCVTPGVDLFICGGLSAAALAYRDYDRANSEGFTRSLAPNLIDTVFSIATFGVVGVPGAAGLGDAPDAVLADFGVSAEPLGGSLSVAGRALVKASLAGPDIASFGIGQIGASGGNAPGHPECPGRP
jgi:hypothetical protein